MCGYDMAKTIYPITCNCCYPAQILKNYDAKKYHLKRMAKKRAAASAAESESDSNIASTPSVNIFICLFYN
jgi:hypothetical protein